MKGKVAKIPNLTSTQCSDLNTVDTLGVVSECIVLPPSFGY